jgi:excisionase family DNA binding protein
MRENGDGQPAERLAYSVSEVAAITGLSRDLLYDQMRIGRLAYLKVGRRRIITRQHLEAFLTQETPYWAVLTTARGVEINDRFNELAVNG